MPQATDPRAYIGLEPAFRNRVERWIAAGQGEFWLPVGGGWRSHERQIELRRINGCPDVWTAPSSSCRIPTAIPGTSRHERGEAVDIEGNKRRAKELASQFGLTDIPREDWHFQAIGGTASTPPPPPPTGGGGNVFQDELDRRNGGGTNRGGDAEHDGDECLIHVPSVGIPFGSLPFIPDEIGGQCLFPRSWGRAVGGAFFLSAGAVILLVGTVVLVGQSARLPTPIRGFVP